MNMRDLLSEERIGKKANRSLMNLVRLLPLQQRLSFDRSKATFFSTPLYWLFRPPEARE
jgi:hypothetical protein